MRHHLSALITYARFVSWASGSSVGIVKVARLATAQIGMAGIMGLFFARSRPYSPPGVLSPCAQARCHRRNDRHDDDADRHQRQDADPPFGAQLERGEDKNRRQRVVQIAQLANRVGKQQVQRAHAAHGTVRRGEYDESVSAIRAD